jgi:2',3'-cyclic-nucleotide 2'-phosphodiesterase (5'-nucleotidase family)
MKKIGTFLRILAPLGVILAVALLLFAHGCGRGDLVRIAILHTNDLHGHVFPEKVRSWSVRSGGYAVFASWVKKQREENESKGIATILLDAGDIYAGTPEGNLTKGAAVVDLMNAVGYDALTIGNHEFDDGYINLTELSKRASFPFLAANAVWKTSEETLGFARPYLLKDAGGIMVGIIGVVTPETGMITMAHNVDRIVFHPPAPAVRLAADRLREDGASLIVVLSHLGREEDIALAKEVEGIGAIIGGHSHDLIGKPLRAGPSGTLICQAGFYGLDAGRLDLWVDRETGAIRDHRYQVFVNRELSLPKDLMVDRLLDRIATIVGPEFEETIGLAIADIVGADRGESLLGDMICDALREATGAQVAFQNAYGIRSPLLKGEITRRDVFEVVPFDDQVVVMKMTGARIREVLEQGFSLQKGMIQVSGLTAGYDLRQPAGERLTSLSIGGFPAEDAQEYTVATNSFLAGGGDYFAAFTRGRHGQESGILLRDALADYLKAHSPFYSQEFRPSRLIPERGSAPRQGLLRGAERGDDHQLAVEAGGPQDFGDLGGGGADSQFPPSGAHLFLQGEQNPQSARGDVAHAA